METTPPNWFSWKMGPRGRKERKEHLSKGYRPLSCKRACDDLFWSSRTQTQLQEAIARAQGVTIPLTSCSSFLRVFWFSFLPRKHDRTEKQYKIVAKSSVSGAVGRVSDLTSHYTRWWDLANLFNISGPQFLHLKNEIETYLTRVLCKLKETIVIKFLAQWLTHRKCSLSIFIQQIVIKHLLCTRYCSRHLITSVNGSSSYGILVGWAECGVGEKPGWDYNMITSIYYFCRDPRVSSRRGRRESVHIIAHTLRETLSPSPTGSWHSGLTNSHGWV